MNNFKKMVTGAMVVAVAFGFSAFKSNSPVKNGKFANYYWFQTNQAGTVISQPQARSNTATSLDPSGCTNGLDFCSLGYDESKTTTDTNGDRILAPGVDASDRDASSKED